MKIHIKNHPYSEGYYYAIAHEMDYMPQIGDLWKGSEEEEYTEHVTHIFERYSNTYNIHLKYQIFEIRTACHEYDPQAEEWEECGTCLYYIVIEREEYEG